MLVRDFKFIFSGWSTLLFIEMDVLESNTEGCSGSGAIVYISDTWTSFAFQKRFIGIKRFFARRLVPVGFRYKLLLPRFLALIFLLSIMSISS